MRSERACQRGRGLAARLTRLAVGVPRVVVLTSLGAGVVLSRRLGALVAGLRPWLVPEAPPPRHDTGRVRDRARAAMQAARASGLLSRRQS
jgi:hypothetical protein